MAGEFDHAPHRHLVISYALKGNGTVTVILLFSGQFWAKFIA